jgi:hypothetical protein
VTVRFSPVFNFHQYPAFPSRYDRDHVRLLDRSSWYFDHLPFPDMRDFNEDIADKIRQWAEIPPCSDCGAVLLRGMSHEFCCKPFASRIRNHLPPLMGRELLDHIVELIQSIPNFPRILNRDLRPVLQHACALSPNAGASRAFISDIPYALDSRLCSRLSHTAADSNTPWQYRRDYCFYSLTKQNTPRFSQRSVRFGPRNCHCCHG